MAFVLLPLLKLSAQVSLTSLGAAYTQDFNLLVNTGTSSVVPTGWAFQETGGNTSYSAGTGSGTAGDTYSFGSSSASDRAFGTLLSGSVTSTLGVSFTNNTGATITSLDISYTGEQWRLGATGRADQLNFEYSLNATGLTSGSWTSVSALNFVTPNTSTVVGAVNGNVSGNRSSVSSTIGSLSIASGATVWIRWTDFNATGADDGLGIDDFSLTPNGASAAPTKLAITSFTPASPVAGNAFSITVQSQDGSNAPQNVSANTVFTLSTNGNAGTLGGTISGTINAGSSSTVISGLTLSTSGTNVNLTATRTSGDVLTAGTSANFTVVGVATKLALVGVPSTGFTSTNLTTFTVEAQRADNSVDVNYNGSITVSKASGPGTLSGTTSTTAVNGIATFANLQFDQVGVYTLNATSGTLTPASSSGITISQSPITWDFTTTSPSAGTPYPDLSVSALSQGNNFGTTTLLTNSSASSGYTGASGNNNAGAAARTGALVTGTSGSAYFEFSLTPTAGHYVALTSISFGSRSTTTGPQAFSLRSSLDNYGSDLATGSMSNGGTWVLKSSAVTSATSTAGNAVTFRIYGHSGTGTASSGTANWRIDDLILGVDVQQCVAPSITVNSGAICTGNSFTLVPNGGVSYTVTGGSYTVNPTANANYTVTGADIHGCTNTAVSSVTVNSLPNVAVNSGAICTGNSFTMNATGAVSYVYSGGTNVVNPTANIDYTVTGTDANGCSNTAVSSVTVNALPTVSITGTTSICMGSGTTLTANGAVSYLWNTSATTTSIAVSPTITTSYSVTGTDINGCSNTSAQSVVVNTPPNASISKTDVLCNGGTGSATLTATGGTPSYTYLWSNGATTPALSGLAAGTYSGTVTDSNGCSDLQTVTIMEPSAISLSSTGTSTICAGSSATISANATGGTGTITYTWNPGNLVNATQVVSPGSATTYTVIAADANGCSAQSTELISVNALPIVSITGTSTLCVGTSSVLTANGALTYLWNTGASTTSISISPSTNTTYTVTGTDANGCSNDATKNITTVNCMGVSSVSCGLVIYNMNVSSSAANVSGAVQYRFNFYDNTTNALIASKTQASRTFTFNSVSGLYYGNTYKWTVAVDKGAGFGPESNSGCTVVFAAPITNVPCGNSFANLNVTSAAQAVAGATGYRFSFYDNSTNALVATKSQASNTLNFSTVSGLNYGQTYRWRVEVQYNNGSTLLYGPMSTTSLCTVTFNAPQTTLPCGNTYPSTSSSIAFAGVYGASYYRVTFYDATTSALVATKVFGSNVVYFNQVPGLVFNKTYKWTVEVYYNNAYGAPSSNNCLVTWGSAGSIVMNGSDNTNARLLSDNSDAEMEPLLIHVYPNPNNGLFNIELSSASQVIVTDALGQIVLNKTIEVGNHSINIQDQPTGIYFVKVIQDGRQQVIKLIKE